MSAALALVGLILLGMSQGAALVVLVIVACSSTDHRDVRWSIIGVLTVLGMMAALVVGAVRATWGLA